MQRAGDLARLHYREAQVAFLGGRRRNAEHGLADAEAPHHGTVAGLVAPGVPHLLVLEVHLERLHRPVADGGLVPGVLDLDDVWKIGVAFVHHAVFASLASACLDFSRMSSMSMLTGQ